MTQKYRVEFDDDDGRCASGVMISSKNLKTNSLLNFWPRP